MRWSFNLISMLLALFFGQSTYAATLVATFDGTGPDMNIYNTGDPVTVTLTGTTLPYSPNGIIPADPIDTHIDVRIVGTGFTEVSTELGIAGTCVSTMGCIPGADWVAGGAQGATVGSNYIALMQIGALSPGVPLTNNMTPPVPPSSFYTGNSSLTSIFTTTAGAPGVYTIDLALGFYGFFGQTVLRVAGPQTLGTYTVGPEPSTASLLALGLLAVAVRQRGKGR